VLETLGALAVLGGDEAVPAVDRVMRKTRWFARTKLRALKRAAIDALQTIGTPAATAAITGAAATGDRLLKRAASAAGGA
jgi:HEAT repeat protein